MAAETWQVSVFQHEEVTPLSTLGATSMASAAGSHICWGSERADGEDDAHDLRNVAILRSSSRSLTSVRRPLKVGMSLAQLCKM